jgi:hypothetical protein
MRRELPLILLARVLSLGLVLVLPVLIAIPSSLSSRLPAPASSIDVVAITGGTLLDGSGAAPVQDAVVIIAGDSITAVGPRAQLEIPAGARVIDARRLVIARSDNC